MRGHVEREIPDRQVGQALDGRESPGRTRTGRPRPRPSGECEDLVRVGVGASSCVESATRSNRCRGRWCTASRGAQHRSRDTPRAASRSSAHGRAQKAEKRRAFHVTRGGAHGGMPQAAPHGASLRIVCPSSSAFAASMPGRCVAVRRPRTCARSRRGRTRRNGPAKSAPAAPARRGRTAGKAPSCRSSGSGASARRSAASTRAFRNASPPPKCRGCACP